ncbi:MAG: HEPN domain-containing protein [Anaerolineae bacterium]|nr:HEPN domain-containing protein [Anaerolineae bacterium]MCX8066579.1 HEPN domain-containing protein [Anaerolineae bacterium]MDW7992477.1 HEPN domain-containing protein [Anaerolineae bacterium]
MSDDREVPGTFPLLDRHYIQSRYPNGFASGYPAEFYDLETARRALQHARTILQFVREHLA